MNSDTALEEAILDTELRHINFFNGRLLTGGDLEAEQSAEHAHARHLGMALGYGVAFGLEVTKASDSSATSPVLIVSAGLAVNRAGQTLRLNCDQRVAITQPANQSALDECVFKDCNPLSAGATLTSAAAYYVLTIAPASRLEGRAPVSGLGNAIALCNSRYLSEGVKFQLHALNVSSTGTAAQSRNSIAYQCFGLPEKGPTDFLPNALIESTPAAYGLETRVAGLLNSDLPLAVIEWTGTTLGFIDTWSARRRISRPPADAIWEPLIGDRRPREGEAMFSQFAQQMNEIMRNETGLNQIKASNRFIYLPPAGVLSLAKADGSTVFDADQFFAGQAVHPEIYLGASFVEVLLRDALRYPPINLSQRDPIRLYRIVNGSVVQPYVIFTTALLAFPSAARFDISRWNFANFN
jgi:hypothetical protein